MTTPSTPLASTASPAADGGARRGFRIGWMPAAIIVVLVVLAAAATYWYTVLRFVQSTDDAYVGGNVTVMAPKVMSGWAAAPAGVCLRRSWARTRAVSSPEPKGLTR